jgi:hypothetical protein
MAFLKKMFGKYDTDINKDVLLMACVGRIYSWDGIEVKHSGGSGFTHSIAEFKNNIYEGNIGGVLKLNSFSEKYFDGESVSDRQGVMALCAHDGSLYSSVSEPFREDIHEVRDVFKDEVVAKRSGTIYGIGSHKGKLYDGGRGIFETVSGKKVSDNHCESMCSSNGTLYACGGVGIFDALSGKIVNEKSTSFTTRGMCTYNNRLVDAQQSHGVRDTLTNNMILDFGQVNRVRYPHGPVNQFSDMISVNGLTFIGMRDGKGAALSAIDKEYQNQLSYESVKSAKRSLGSVKTEVVNIMEPGTKLHFEQALFMPNFLAEFRTDTQLGMLHGQGRGHSLMKIDALRDVLEKHPGIGSYPELAKEFFNEGYHIKRAGYIYFDSE